MKRITFATTRLEKLLTVERETVRAFGAANAQKIRLRMNALWAADSLAVFEPNTPPERCHELKGDLAGVFSFDVKQPFRLLFRPLTNIPRPADRLAYWATVTEVEIIDVRDTHD